MIYLPTYYLSVFLVKKKKGLKKGCLKRIVGNRLDFVTILMISW